MSKLNTILTNNTMVSRQETIDNIGYTVYPVIMMKEGVHNDVLYTLAELTKFHETWNGRTVPILHPEDDKGTPVSANSPVIYNERVVGTVFNTLMDEDSLKAEIWLNNTKLDTLAPEIKTFLQAGGQMDVSTGLFSEDIFQNGVFKGEAFESIAINIRPDHLAILPGVNGACSWADGCGIRANKSNKENNEKEGGMKRGNKKEAFEKGDADQYFTPLSDDEIKAHATDYTQTVNLLRNAVNAMDVDNQRYYYLSRAYSDHAIYRVNYIGINTPSKYMSQEYSINEGTVVWTSEAIEVEKITTFSPKITTFEDKNDKNDKNQGTKTNNKKEKKMGDIKTMKECCPDKVEELIKGNSNFTEEDKETLLGMTEAAFALTINAATPTEPKKEPEKKKEPKTNSKEETPKQLTLDDLPADMRESVEYGKKVMANKKKDLVDKIKANKSNLFSDTELEGFGIDMLEKIAGSAPAAPTKVNDYSMGGNGETDFNINADDDAPEALPSPHQNWEKKDKE